MHDQIIEISNDDFSLSLNRGFLDLTNGDNRAQISLDNILSVIISANRATISKNIINAICDNGGAIILCGDKYIPSALILPYINHWLGAPRARAQVAASVPLNKNLWKEIVSRKIANQAAVLAALRPESPAIQSLRDLSRSVRSNDAGNCEGVAAKIYFKALFGPQFIRDRDMAGINRLLNYAYTILRSAIARAIAGNGLLPQFGIKHCSAPNTMPLADDLIEPFRPVADMMVFNMIQNDAPELTTEVKRAISSILSMPMKNNRGRVALSDAVYEFVGTLEQSYSKKSVRLEFPELVL
jgi:CRISPR-associated protein Cas1